MGKRAGIATAVSNHIYTLYIQQDIEYRYNFVLNIMGCKTMLDFLYIWVI